jgi:probable rRNA maturation factor
MELNLPTSQHGLGWLCQERVEQGKHVSIEVCNESGVPVDESLLASVARFSLDALHVNPAAELSILVVTEEVMSELHERWMDEPGPTDVLSFPMDELRPGTEGEDSPAGLLGDVVLCPQVAAAQARQAGHSTAEELLPLTTHGILHLLGYDHAEPDEEKEMFGLQRKLLLTFLATRSGKDRS